VIVVKKLPEHLNELPLFDMGMDCTWSCLLVMSMISAWYLVDNTLYMIFTIRVSAMFVSTNYGTIPYSHNYSVENQINNTSGRYSIIVPCDWAFDIVHMMHEYTTEVTLAPV